MTTSADYQNFLKNITVDHHPELIRSLRTGESLDILINLRPEASLIRWFNYHLYRANANIEIKTFQEAGLKSSEAYTILLGRIFPAKAEEFNLSEVTAKTSNEERAATFIEKAKALGVCKYLTVDAIVSGSELENKCFLAYVFNISTGLYLPTDEEIRQLYSQLQDLRNRLAACLEDTSAKRESIGIIEAEIEQLKAKISLLAQEETECAIRDSQQELERIKAATAQTVNAIKSTISQNKQQVTGLEAEVERLKKAITDVERDHGLEIEEQHSIISKLKESIAALEAEKKALSDQVARESSDLAAISTQLVLSEATRDALRRAIADHNVHSKTNIDNQLSKLGAEPHAWSKIPGVQTDDDSEHEATESSSTFETDDEPAEKPAPVDEDEQALRDNLDAQKHVLEAYQHELKQAMDTLAVYEEKTNEKLKAMGEQLADYVTNDDETQDSISNIKKLLDLMIEKCKKQTSQIKNLEMQLAKRVQLNDVMGDKIRLIAEDALKSRERKSLFGKKKKSTKHA